MAKAKGDRLKKELGLFDVYVISTGAMISSGFFMGETEVTQGQWAQVMDEKPSEYTSGLDHPVESVSWNRVQEFLQEINKRDRTYRYRLPTEAEWEYACRAGTRTEFHSGEDAESLGSFAVYGNNYRSGHRRVKSKRPNAWGLYDMMGNVEEWTADNYDASYYDKSPARDPQGPRASTYRVFRGGSYYGKAKGIRCASRGRNTPTHFNFSLGFRLVAEPR